LRPDARNTFIYGKQIGTKFAADETVAGNEPFLHSPCSLQRLWDEVGRLTNTRWKVEVDIIKEKLDLAVTAKDVLPVRYAIYQIS
jgi:hypothetical protein